MAKKIKTGWEFSDADTHNEVMSELIQISKSFKVNFEVSSNTVDVEYNGKKFKSLSNITPGYDDTIILDPKYHGDISNYDLEVIGTFIHVHDIGLPIKKNVMYIRLDGSPITPDYATWISNGDNIEVECLVDPTNVKAKFPYDGIKQQKILDYLEADPDVQIIDDGIADAGDLARERIVLNAIDSPIPIKQTNFGRISIQLDVGFPDTVKELINYLKRFKLDLYQQVK